MRAGVVVAIGAAAVLSGAAHSGAFGRTSTEEQLLSGVCEASAIVPFGDRFLVGDNETEDRLVAFDGAMRPAGEVPLAVEVEDIEAIATLDDGTIVAVGSQSTNKKGKPRPDRQRILAIGSPAVVPDLTACAACVAAAHLPPKEGGLSVEGAAWWRGSLWLGVRSPLVAGDALLLRTAGDPRASVRVDATYPLALDGLGVRDLMVDGDALLVLAGPADAARGPHALFRLSAPDATPERLDLAVPDGSEGLVRRADGTLIAVTDGDGKPGQPCVVPSTWVSVRP